jgi:hypothetical protein
MHIADALPMLQLFCLNSAFLFVVCYLLGIVNISITICHLKT